MARSGGALIVAGSICFTSASQASSRDCQDFDGVGGVVGEFVLVAIGDAEHRDVFGEAVEVGGEVGVGEGFNVGVGGLGCGRLRSLIARCGGEGEQEYEPGFFHAGNYTFVIEARRRRITTEFTEGTEFRKEEDNAEAQRGAELRGEF